MLNPLSKVHLLQGTSSTRDFSRGNTLPLIARPWGMHHWTIQTQQAPWTFNRSHSKIQGVRLTHQPSPWMRDYGNILISPFHGPTTNSMEHQASAFNIDDAVLEPNKLSVDLLRYGITIEMSPSARGALFVFARSSEAAIRVRFHFDGEHEVDWTPTSKRVAGSSKNNHGGVPENFSLYFTGEFSVAPEAMQIMENGAVVTFPQAVHTLELRLAGSFISQEMAELVIERELADYTLETLSDEGSDVWNELLSRMEIDARGEDQERTFYSCLYRCLLFPRFLDETDAKGDTVHYSPYDGRVYQGPLCSDNGFWDTYRTLYPLLALVYPDILSRILDGWLSACRESGWSPKWPSPGPRDCMIGTHYNVIVADAIAKGVVDWNVEEAFAYLWKDSTIESDSGLYGRQGLDDYTTLGYVPCDKHAYSVSSTLDYAFNDFCVAQVARYLGREREAKILTDRSASYKNVFDTAVGFMRGRNADGTWKTPFNEYEWGGPYIEGGPWQHLFHVPHDPSGLIRLFGGNSQICQKLDTMLSSPPHYETGSYGYEIHEMTEMALAGFGQYAHSNQPVHNYLFLYALAGQPAKTDYWVHRVANELYSPHHLPGDEDNGEMSAWYIFACLGMYPFSPGTPDFIKFTPLARSVSIKTESNILSV